MQPIIDRSYLVEINLGTVANGKQVYFNFTPQLENVQFIGVQVMNSNQLAVSPNGSAVVTNAGLADLTVTFAVQDTQDVYLYPTTDLCAINSYGLIRTFNNKKFNLTKSFITMLSTTTIANNESILFNFIYTSIK